MTRKNDEIGRFGGPGSSQQDREHPGKNRQPTGHKGGGDQVGTPPASGAPANLPRSRVSGGGGEHDVHHTETENRS